MKSYSFAVILLSTLILIAVATSYPAALARSMFIAWFACALGIALIYRSQGINPLRRRHAFDYLGIASFAGSIGMGISEMFQ